MAGAFVFAAAQTSRSLCEFTAPHKPEMADDDDDMWSLLDALECQLAQGKVAVCLCRAAAAELPSRRLARGACACHARSLAHTHTPSLPLPSTITS